MGLNQGQQSHEQPEQPQGWAPQGSFPALCLPGVLLLLLLGSSWCVAQLAEAPGRCGRILWHQQEKGEQLWGWCHP